MYLGFIGDINIVYIVLIGVVIYFVDHFLKKASGQGLFVLIIKPTIDGIKEFFSSRK